MAERKLLPQPEITLVRMNDLFTARTAWRAEVSIGERKAAGTGKTTEDALISLVEFLAKEAMVDG